jgi:hypothetical protein
MNTTLTGRLIRRSVASTTFLSLVLLSIGAFEHQTVSTLLAQVQVQAPERARDWEPAIRKFEESDKTNPPKPGSIVFTGRSSIVRWSTLADDMKPLEVVNRAFGGSQYSDVDQYAKRIVNVYHPRAALFMLATMTLRRTPRKRRKWLRTTSCSLYKSSTQIYPILGFT